jgi:hypothetical protein
MPVDDGPVALGKELIAITNVLLGLPVPEYFLEYISKLMTENEATKGQLISKANLKVFI